MPTLDKLTFDDIGKAPKLKEISFDDIGTAPQLSFEPTGEGLFQKEYSETAQRLGLNPNPDDPRHFYDYRTLFRETGSLGVGPKKHFPSKFKLLGHPNLIVDGKDTRTGEIATQELREQNILARKTVLNEPIGQGLQADFIQTPEIADPQDITFPKQEPPIQERPQGLSVVSSTPILPDEFTPQQTQKPTIPSREFQGVANEFVRALGRGSLNIGSGLLNTFAKVGEASIFDVEKIDDLADKARQASQSPKFQPGTDGGVKGFVANAVGDALPFMAAVIAATLTTGPVGGFGVAFAVEGSNAYEDAIDSGAEESQAEIEGFVVGSINAALELLQVERVLKFAKIGKGSIKEIAKAAKAKAVKKIAQLAGKFGKEAIKTSITEGIQEALQETTSVLAPGITGRELPTGEEAVRRIGQAALGGAVAGPVLGGAGAITTAAISPKEAAGVAIPETQPVTAKPQAAKPPTTAITPAPTAKKPSAIPEKVAKPLPAKEVTAEKPEVEVSLETISKQIDTIFTEKETTPAEKIAKLDQVEEQISKLPDGKEKTAAKEAIEGVIVELERKLPMCSSPPCPN